MLLLLYFQSYNVNIVVFQYFQSNSFSFLVLFLLSLVMGIVLNFTMFLCTIVNSALTTTIVGVLKGVGSTVSTPSFWTIFIYLYSRWFCYRNRSSCVHSFVGQTLGFVILGGVEVHALNVTGLVINTAGGVWYSYAKYQQKKNRPPKLTST